MTQIKVLKTLVALLVLAVIVTLPAAVPAEEGQPAQTITNAADDAGQSGETAQIDINTADLEQLMLLPGVGPSLADRILKHRAEIGKFQKKEDIIAVKGIGQKKFEKISERIIIR